MKKINWRDKYDKIGINDKESLLEGKGREGTGSYQKSFKRSRNEIKVPKQLHLALLYFVYLIKSRITHSLEALFRVPYNRIHADENLRSCFVLIADSDLMISSLFFPGSDQLLALYFLAQM